MVSETELKVKVNCVVGLGYVDLPQLEDFSKYYNVIGFDVDKKKVASLAWKYNDLEITTDPTKIKEAEEKGVLLPYSLIC